MFFNDTEIRNGRKLCWTGKRCFWRWENGVDYGWYRSVAKCILIKKIEIHIAYEILLISIIKWDRV